MPAWIRVDTCDGCKGQDEVACVAICPDDLMRLDRDGSKTGRVLKAFNQEPERCWDCFACVKMCPRQAIECRPPPDVVPLGASVQPVRGTDSIMWTVKYRDGTMKRFRFPTRTIAEGPGDLYGAKPEADLGAIGEPGYFTHAGVRIPGDPGELIRK